jgi:hypothetical protein
MPLIYNKTILWFSLALGLLISTYGFVAGPISLLSLIDVVKGNKPFSELHKPRPFSAVIKRGPDVALDDDNVYMSSTNFKYDIYNILSIFLANKTQIEIDSIKRNLEPLSKLRQVYWESNRYVKVTEEQSNLKKEYDGRITGGYEWEIDTRTLKYLLQNIPKKEILLSLKSNNIFTKSSDIIIQSKSVMFEFSPTGRLLRIYSR